MPTDLRDFRPTVWADEFADYYNAQPALLDHVSRYDQMATGANRGQTIRIPALGVDAARDIVPGADGTLAEIGDATVDLVLNRFRGHLIQVTPQDERFAHPDARRALLQDVARVQKNDSNSLMLDIADLPAVTQQVNAGGGALTDAVILAAKKALDEAEMPDEDRILAVNPDGENDLMSIPTFISRDYGEGQGQLRIGTVRGFTVIKLPTARFNAAANVVSGMAYHRSAIGAAVATPHVRLTERGGKFDSVIEIGAIWGNVIRKASGIVRVLR